MSNKNRRNLLTNNTKINNEQVEWEYCKIILDTLTEKIASFK